jgi:predicted dehydrogenase
MSKVSNYFSLQGASWLTMANMQLNIEEGRYESAMQEHFNLLFLADLIETLYLGFTQEEHAEVNDRNDMYFEARWLAFPHAYAEAERTKAAEDAADAKRRKTRRTTTR